MVVLDVTSEQLLVKPSVAYDPFQTHVDEHLKTAAVLLLNIPLYIAPCIPISAVEALPRGSKQPLDRRGGQTFGVEQTTVTTVGLCTTIIDVIQTKSSVTVDLDWARIEPDQLLSRCINSQ